MVKPEAFEEAVDWAPNHRKTRGKPWEHGDLSHKNIEELGGISMGFMVDYRLWVYASSTIYGVLEVLKPGRTKPANLRLKGTAHFGAATSRS